MVKYSELKNFSGSDLNQKIDWITDQKKILDKIIAEFKFLQQNDIKNGKTGEKYKFLIDNISNSFFILKKMENQKDSVDYKNLSKAQDKLFNAINTDILFKTPTTPIQPELNDDIFLEITKHSDIETIEKLCKTDSYNKNLCKMYRQTIAKNVLTNYGYDYSDVKDYAETLSKMLHVSKKLGYKSIDRKLNSFGLKINLSFLKSKLKSELYLNPNYIEEYNLNISNFEKFINSLLNANRIEIDADGDFEAEYIKLDNVVYVLHNEEQDEQHINKHFDIMIYVKSFTFLTTLYPILSYLKNTSYLKVLSGHIGHNLNNFVVPNCVQKFDTDTGIDISVLKNFMNQPDKTLEIVHDTSIEFLDLLRKNKIKFVIDENVYEVDQ